MLKLPLAVLPALSVAEQSTFVVPTGKVLPEDGVQFTVTDPSTMSEADAEKVTTAPDGPVASSTMSEGRVSVGGVVSTTWMLKLPDAVLPRLSVDEQFTLVVPTGKVLPEAGEQVTGRGPSTRSEADAE
jgi:hypothetical protein